MSKWSAGQSCQGEKSYPGFVSEALLDLIWLKSMETSENPGSLIAAYSDRAVHITNSCFS